MSEASGLLRRCGRFRNANSTKFCRCSHCSEVSNNPVLGRIACCHIIKLLRVDRGRTAARRQYDYVKNGLHRHIPLALMMALTIAQSGNVAIAELPEKEHRDESFYGDHADGWHWYKDPVVPAEPPELAESTRITSPTSHDEPSPLSAQWLRLTLPQLRDKAIDSPTRDNVSAYFYAQRIMMDKAQVFSDVAQDVVTNDPLLDENVRFPFASAAKATVLKGSGDAKRAILDDLSDLAALWLFYDPACSHCETQIGPINRLVEKHGITIEVISKQGVNIPGLLPEIKVREDNGHFAEFGVNFTPAIMLVKPPKNLWIVSQGFTAYDVLVDRIVAAANEYGMVNQELYFKAHPMSRGVLSADQETPTAVDWNNPSEWVPLIQRQIAETYGIDSPSGGNDEN